MQLPRESRGAFKGLVALALIASLATMVTATNAHAQPCVPQLAKLLGTDGLGAGQVGSSASISADGNTALIGAPSDNGNIGAAYVFIRSVAGVWSQQAKLEPTSSAVAGVGWSVSLSADGNTALVGAHVSSSFAGAAYVFIRSGEGLWTQQTRLFPTGGDGSFGYSVSVSGDGNTALVGAPNDDEPIGAAYVFDRVEDVWTQQARCQPTGGEGPYQFFGDSVSLSGDGNTALIGAPADNNETGAAYVFVRPGGWTQQARLLRSDGGFQPLFGFGVSLNGDGNTALIGALHGDALRGAAYVFIRSGGVWTQQGNPLVPTDGVGEQQYFGFSLSLSSDGNTAVVGAYLDDNHVGAAYIFTRSADVWAQLGDKLVPSDAVGSGRFGYSVAISADGVTALIGAPFDNNQLGAAYAFGITPTIIFSQQPLDAAVCIGGAATFSVEAQSDTPVTYQWRRDGINLVDRDNISGATTATLTISPVTAGDEAGYDVVLTNLCGSVTSSPAGLTVQTVAIIEQPQTPPSVCAGRAVLFHVTATGNLPITYQWYHDGVPVEDEIHSYLLIEEVTPDDEGQYYVVVCSTSCCTTSDLATLDVTVISGDVNYDGRVDLTDLATLLAHFGTPSGATQTDGDLDGDGDVDLSDLALLLAHFGANCP